MTDEAALSQVICVCTGNHDPERRIECRYALNAATKALASDWLAARVSAAATRARAEAGGQIARTLMTERNARVLHSPAWFAFDDAARIARGES